jgi:putative lipid A biosynthesis lauroyl acyltransferase
LEIEKKGKLKETMQYNMQKIFHEFEEIIREYPDQYMWQHKRWRKK